MQVMTRMALALLAMIAITSVTMVGSAAAQEAAPVDDCWLAQAKKPLPWLEFEGDFRARWDYYKAPFKDRFLSVDPVTGAVDFLGRERNRGGFRTRLGFSIKPLDGLEFNTRAVWEFFVVHKPNGQRDVDMDEVLLDKLNVTWKADFGSVKNTLVVGRQEITDLDNWLVLDGTPLDGSRTIFFDAIRDTLEISDIQTTIDLIAIFQGAKEDKYIKPLGYRESRGRAFADDNEVGAILWVRNKSIERTQIDVAYIFRHADPVNPNVTFGTGLAIADYTRSDVHTLYASVEHAFDDNWVLRVAGAGQYGHRRTNFEVYAPGPVLVTQGRDSTNYWAYAANARLTYKFRDEWDTDAYVGYEYLSGSKVDDTARSYSFGFDPLWGRWPQYSEIVTDLGGLENGRAGVVTNMHRGYVGLVTRPKPFELAATYHLLFADKKEANQGAFRGHLVTASARWDINEHVAMQAVGEAFFPGSYYRDWWVGGRNTSFFARYEIVFKW